MSFRFWLSRDAGRPESRRASGIPLPSLGQILLSCLIIGLGWMLRDELQRRPDATRSRVTPHPDPTEQIQAVEELVDQGASATPELIALLSNDDTKVRRFALYGLGRLKQQSSVPAIRRLLNDDDPEIRSCALGALSSVCDDRAELMAIALRLANDSSDLPRSLALQILDSYETDAIPGIANLLNSPNPAVRLAAVEALTGIDRHRRDPVEVNALLRNMLVDEHPLVRLSALESVVARGAVTVDDVRNWLRDPNRRIVKAGYRGVWSLGAEGAELLPELQARLTPADSRFPDQVRVLRVFGTAAAPLAPEVERLIPVLEPAARVEAIVTLRGMGVETDTLEPHLVPLLSATDSHVRLAAGKVLAEISPAQVRRQVALLVRELEAHERTLTAADLDALRGLGAQAEVAVPLLVRLLADERPEVVRQALLTLRAIGSPAAPAVPALRAILRRTDSRARQIGLVALALGAIGPAAKTAGPNLAFALDNPREFIQGTPMTTSRWPERRFEIIWALGQIGDDSPAVAVALRQQLRFDKEFPSTVSSDTATYRQLILESLARITGNSDNLFNDMLPLLEHNAATVRMQAALSISRLPGDRSQAVAPLTAALFDQDCYVRTAAALALESIGPAAVSAEPALAEAIRDTRNSVPNSILRRPRPVDADALQISGHLADLSVKIAARRALQSISGSGRTL